MDSTTEPTSPPDVRCADLRVLLHHEKRLGLWVAHAVECDLAAQGADATAALGGILRQVAALAWIRQRGGSLPAASPPALLTAWTSAKADADDDAAPSCLLHDVRGTQSVQVHLVVRRLGGAMARLPGDPASPLKRTKLLADLTKRRRSVRQEAVTLLGGWHRPAPLEVLAITRTRLRPCELPPADGLIAPAVAGALLRAA